MVDAASNSEVSPIVAQFLRQLFIRNPSEANQQVLAELGELQALSSAYAIQNSNVGYRLVSLVKGLVERAESKLGHISHSDFWEFLEGLPLTEQARWMLFETSTILKDQMASPSSEIKELKSLSKKVRMQLSLLEDAKMLAIAGGQSSEGEILDLERVLKKSIEQSRKLLNNYF